MKAIKSQARVPDVFSGYEPTNPSVQRLYAKAKALQWDAMTALDWEAPIDTSSPVHAAAFPMLKLPLFGRLSPAAMDRVIHAFTQNSLSQFLHGEQGALMVAARLIHIAPDLDAKLYAATQAMDEARHLEVFSAYLGRTDGIRPVTRSLRTFVEQILNADSALKTLIGMQVIVEGAALSNFHLYAAQCRDPLLAGILDGVIRDEARHVGFGNLYVKDAVADMHPDDREDLADFCFDAVLAFSMTGRELLRNNAVSLEAEGISLDDVMRDAARVRAEGHDVHNQDSVRSGITDFILPTLQRVGLLTPRVKARFDNARFPASPQSALIDQLEEIVANA